MQGSVQGETVDGRAVVRVTMSGRALGMSELHWSA